ncbi:hypothetical protein WJX81_002757 [Elliptochloris bilobata]|uniref:BZIP domain-containing protein n=1 Tax=Elliptochloris bilobata TaxID=381761 RepID=A0AAW1QW98_9CHLO
MQAASAAGASGGRKPSDSSGKRKRGNKPKYVYSTQQEVVAHRCERNRDTALRSYYKRKAEEERLKGEIAALREERTALEGLLQCVRAPSIDTGRLGQLLRQGSSPEAVLEMVSAGKLSTS